MNKSKKFSLLHFKSLVKRLTFVVFIGTIIVMTACSKDNDKDESEDNTEVFPSLKITNQNTDSRLITSVKLVGYEFNNLSIDVDDSQTFILDEGMSGGYSNINVTCSYKYGAYPVASKSIKVDFSNGKTTTITFKGCISFEGCSGFYLE
nr:hypothetical protein [uncultured Draconibacterium sp.]